MSREFTYVYISTSACHHKVNMPNIHCLWNMIIARINSWIWLFMFYHWNVTVLGVRSNWQASFCLNYLSTKFTYIEFTIILLCACVLVGPVYFLYTSQCVLFTMSAGDGLFSFDIPLIRTDFFVFLVSVLKRHRSRFVERHSKSEDHKYCY